MEMKTLDEMGITPELLKAMEQQRVQAANDMKDAQLASKVPKIMDGLYKLTYAKNNFSRKEIIQKINKECSKWLKEYATYG